MIAAASRALAAALPVPPPLPKMRQLLRRVKSRLDGRFVVLGFAVLVIALNNREIAARSHFEKQTALQDAVAQNVRLAAALEEYTSLTLAHAAASAHFVAREYSQLGSAINLAELRAQQALDPQLFAAATIMDENGSVVASSRSHEENLSIDSARAESFAVHAQERSPTLAVGKPVRSTTDGTSTIPLTLRVDKPDGSFGGIVSLEVDATRFTGFDSGAPPRSDDVLALVGLDTIARSRRTGQVFSAGESLAGSPMFNLGDRDSVDLVAVSPVDGVRRLFSVRKVAGYPLLVGAGVSEFDALADFRERMRKNYFRSGVLTIIIALLATFVIVAMTRGRRAFAQLRAREEEFRTATESMPQLVWLADADGRHEYFNQQWVEYTGLSLEQSVGDGWTTAFEPAEQESAVQRWTEAVSRGQVYEAEYRLRRADGAYRWMLARALPLTDDTGKVTRWFGTSTDIDNQVVAQIQLREAQQVAHVGSWSRYQETGLLTWSEELYNIFGLSPAEFVPSDDAVAELIHPDDRAEFLRDQAQQTAMMQPYRRDIRILRADGAVRTVQHCVAVEPARGDTNRRLHGTVQDVTEAREAERQLKEQAELLDLTDDAIIVREFDDTVRSINRGAERLYGWTEEEVVGRNVHDFAFAAPDEFIAAKSSVEEHGHWSGEMKQLRKDGSALTVSSRWTIVPGRLGTERSILIVNRDVTEQKNFEQQLLRAQRLESISTLASGVAHDLNNVLAPVLMAAPLLRNETLSASGAKLVSIIEDCAERGTAIVQQVTTFARGADGARVLLQPAHLLTDLAKLVGDSFPSTITVETSYAQDLWPVEADSAQLHQVLLNLCTNACEAMPDGGRLSVTAANFDVDENYAAMTPGAEAGPHILFVVSDTGRGIARHLIDKIYDPFFTTKPAGKGTGLGLSTALGIVKSHGGILNAYSSPEGTTMRLLIPASPAAGTLRPAGVGDLPQGRGETILVVDDEPTLREVAEAVLLRSGYKVLIADSGPAALSVFAEHSAEIALVLTHLAMPLMDGIALARTVSRMRAGTPVLLSTGREEELATRLAGESSVRATLTKPYTQSALLRLLDRVLNPPDESQTS